MAASALISLSLVLAASAATLGEDQLATRTALLQAFDEAVTITPSADAPPVCLTGLVRDLEANWDLFQPADQQRMADFLAPWGGEGLGPRNIRPEGDEPPPPPPAERDEPCFGHQSGNYLLTDHFSVEWANGVDQADAEAFAEALEYSWEKEVDEFGWNRPDGTETYPMLAYIENNDSYSGAYTTVDYCNGEGYVPYIVAYSGCWYSASWADSMAAHEFNHTIQFSTSYAPEFWYWEASAIWMEEQVYPAHNYWAYYVDSFSANPHIGLTASSQGDYDIFYHMYGAGIFNFLLDNWYDGHDTVKGMWDYAGNRGGQYSLSIWDNVAGIDLDFEQVFIDFMAANTVMDYDEQRSFSDIDIHDTVSGLPDAGESGSSDEPQSLGLNYIRFDDSLGGNGGDLHVSFEGEAGPDRWFAVLVSTDSAEVAEIVEIDLDEANAGDGWIAFQGGDVYLVVSPWDESAVGYHYNWDNASSWSYTWTAELGDMGTQPGDSGEPDTGYDKIDDLPERPDDGDEDGIGLPSCGCAAGHGEGGALVGLLALAGLAVRRRRG